MGKEWLIKVKRWKGERVKELIKVKR